jgi:hypothetical protein
MEEVEASNIGTGPNEELPIGEFHAEICYSNARLWRQDSQRHQRRRTLRVAKGRAAQLGSKTAPVSY